MAIIKNPILRGFNPDPSICRVDDDYYIATSTFEWFPGIQIHHSTDLVNWRLLTHPLNTLEHLNMIGMDNSEGVYAPTLSYADGKFWLCFSNVHSCRGNSWMATPCFVVTASSIEGPWSLPVAIGSYGFDPSLFHDDDGNKYLVNMLWDGRKGTNFFAGIVIQQFDPASGKLIGPLKNVFAGTQLGCTEGPQILKKDGYYYLVTAEGGTGDDHAVTVCRARHIFGPYEVHPHNPMLTSRFQQHARLQRAGHGFFFQTQTGDWFMTHLAGRQIKDPQQAASEQKFGYSILGRESCLQKICWREGWPYLEQGGSTPLEQVSAPNLPSQSWPRMPVRDEFEDSVLAKSFQTLREPITDDWASLTARPGFLRLFGRQYIYSRYQQSLVARRWQSFYAHAETALEFAPQSYLQMAGLVVYYSRTSHYFLKQSRNDAGKLILQIVQYQNDIYDELPEVEIAESKRIYLKVELAKQWYQFHYSLNGVQWQPIGPALNSTPMSDEGSDDIFRFTGSFVGLFACDISGQNWPADFDYFEYQEQFDRHWD